MKYYLLTLINKNLYTKGVVILDEKFKVIAHYPAPIYVRGNFKPRIKNAMKKYNIPPDDCYAFNSINKLKNYIKLKIELGVKPYGK